MSAKKTKYRKVRTLKDIQKDPRVSDIFSERSDGHDEPSTWWCYLKSGWQDASNESCHTIHETTLRKICKKVNAATEWPDDPDLQI